MLKKGIALLLALLMVMSSLFVVSSAEDGAAEIDNSKCVSCGACVYQCPFGAIMDKSFIINVIDMIQKSKYVFSLSNSHE